jgi:hypothetical protein
LTLSQYWAFQSRFPPKLQESLIQKWKK